MAWWVGFNLRAAILAVPPVLTRVRADLDLSYTAAGLLTALPVLLLGLAALPGAALVRRLGGHRTVVLGLAATAAGCAVRILPPEAAWLYAGTVLLAAGIAVAQPGLPVVLQAWFPGGAQRASAVVTFGLIAGEVVAAGATLPVIAPLTGGGWRGTMVFWTFPALLALLLWWRSPVPAAAAAAAAQTSRLRPLLRTPRLRWMSGLFAAQSLVYFSANTWIPTVTAGGADSRLAALDLTLLNAVQVPVTLALIVTRRPFVRSRAFYVTASASSLAGVLGLLLAPDAAPPLCALLTGAGVSATFAGLLAYPPTTVRAAEVAPFTAVMLTAGYTTAFLGPLCGGAALDLLQRRTAPFIPIAAGGLAMLLTSLRLPLSGSPASPAYPDPVSTPDDDRIQPARFDYDNQQRALLVEWRDGAVHRIPFAELRRACPCAVCQGELGRPGRFAVDPELHPGEDELADINLVGLYGMGARWADGHDTGIYPFERLRSLGERTGG